MTSWADVSSLMPTDKSWHPHPIPRFSGENPLESSQPGSTHGDYKCVPAEDELAFSSSFILFYLPQQAKLALMKTMVMLRGTEEYLLFQFLLSSDLITYKNRINTELVGIQAPLSFTEPSWNIFRNTASQVPTHRTCRSLKQQVG